MLIVCALLAASPLTFLEQHLPGVEIGSAAPFSGRPTTNYLQVDVNGDGFLDLVLAEGILVQERGQFPETQRLPWPEGMAGEVDAFGSTFFLRTSSQLTVYGYQDGRWNETIRQAFDWPGARSAWANSGVRGGKIQFRRFVHDLDGDNTPELVDLSTGGVHVFRRQGDQYEPAGVMDILPVLTLSPAAPQEIWPPSNRRIVLPEQQMSCRLLVMAQALTLLTSADVGDDRVTYQRETIQLKRLEDGVFAESGRNTDRSAPVPLFVRPCQLNQDGVLDFAGGHWLLSESNAFPMPLYETWASLDGGASFAVRRTPSFRQFRPYCSFVDFDGDGDLDLVTESTRLYEDGLRETINRYLTSRRLPHAIQVYEQVDTAYRDTPSASFSVEFELGAPPISGGAMVSQYESGALVNLTGDFNGDGFLDLAVRPVINRVNIHLAAGWHGFRPEPASSLGIPESAAFSVADINGDGFSDLLVRWQEEGATPSDQQSIAYFSRWEAAP